VTKSNARGNRRGRGNSSKGGASAELINFHNKSFQFLPAIPGFGGGGFCHHTFLSNIFCFSHVFYRSRVFSQGELGAARVVLSIFIDFRGFSLSPLASLTVVAWETHFSN
jgi:hypothetical protein